MIKNHFQKLIEFFRSFITDGQANFLTNCELSTLKELHQLIGSLIKQADDAEPYRKRIYGERK